MIIRKEEKNDYEKVYYLVKESFLTAEHTDGNEHELLGPLRKSENFIPQLSLVAETDNEIVGHIMFTKALIGGRTELILAPLAISPKYQKQGVGSALIKEGHRIAKELGYQYCVLIGSEKYYPRLGYAQSLELGIEVPHGIPEKNFMAIKLCENAPAISGAVKYAKEFGD